MSKLLRKIMTVIFALAVFAGTLFIEGASKIEPVTALEMDVMVVPNEQGATVVSDGQTESVTGERVFEPGDTLQTSNNQLATIRFDNRGVVRLAPLSSLSFRLQDEEGFVFELKQGQAWVNNLSTGSSVNILAGGALLLPRRASFDVKFDAETTTLRVFSSQVNVGLVTTDYPADSVVVFRDAQFVNSFLVAEGSQAVVSLKKVTDNADLLKKLLYSKLIKEFQYALMDPVALAKDSWVSQNRDSDRQLIGDISATKLGEINARNLKYGSLDSFSYDIDQSLRDISDVLTFTEEKRTDRLIQGMLDQLFDAQYLLAFGRGPEAQERITLFRRLVTEGMGEGGDLFQEKMFDRMRNEYAELYYVLPTDPLYNVKVTLSDLLIAHLNGTDEAMIEKLGLIRDYMNYAYRLAPTHQLEARLSLQQYFSRFENFVKTEKSRLATASYLLSEENQIMDNLLRQYSQFYQDSFFAMKSFLEQERLKLLPEGNDKNEERQTIISTKIDFLKQLQSFFLAQKVALNDARLIATRLINEIKDLQPGGDVGVANLFALRLADYGNFLRFLYTTNVSQLRGSSPQNEYDSFLRLQKEQLSIEQVIQEFLGEEEAAEPSITVQGILDQVAEDFENANIVNVQVASPASPQEAYVRIVSAELDGVTFSGDYDWNRKLISQVRSGGELIAEQPTRLSALVFLLKPPAEEPAPVAPQPVTPAPQVSQAERVAKILLLQKLKQNGISAAEENIVVRDIDAGDFVVNGATLVENGDLQMAFAFQNKTNEVSTLLVRTPMGDIRADETYDISELATVARQIYDQAAEVAETPAS